MAIEQFSKNEQKDYWENLWTEEDIPADIDTPSTQWMFYDSIKYRLLKEHLPAAPARVLEVGSGSANISLRMAKDGYSATLLDFSQSALTTAGKRFAALSLPVTLVQGDAEALPFEDGSFDLVMSYGLLEHFVDPRKVISEMVRVLKPGGVYVAEIITRRISVRTLGQIASVALRSPYHLIIKRDPRKALWDFSNVFSPGFYESRLRLASYTSLAMTAGLEDTRSFGFMPFPPVYLPDFMLKPYLRLLKKMERVYHWFFNSSALSLLWCTGWITIGKKRAAERK